MLPFPKYHELMRPLLEAVADGEPHHLKEVVAQMRAQSGLSNEQLAETIPSGQPKFRNRSLWAATYLRKAQALSTPRRGWVQLAECGRQLLSEPGPLTVARLQEFPRWLVAWGTAARDEDSTTGTSEPAQETGTTPEEQIASGIEQLEAKRLPVSCPSPAGAIHHADTLSSIGEAAQNAFPGAVPLFIPMPPL